MRTISIREVAIDRYLARAIKAEEDGRQMVADIAMKAATRLENMTDHEYALELARRAER